MKSVAIRLSGITKEYHIHHEKPTLVEKFIKGPDERFIALNAVDLTIYTNERVGLIGPNGCGKTTLLKIITGIANPTAGILKTHGKIISLIDLEAGFHSDLTGEQNIFLNGMLLRMKQWEIQKKFKKIIEYADLKQFIDAPLFTYSSGMKLRLGFSIAVHANPQILILDEGFGVGDENFRRKAKKTLRGSYGDNKTIIICTHNLELIKQQCQRIIIMDKGSIVHDGGINTLKVYEKYTRS